MKELLVLKEENNLNIYLFENKKLIEHYEENLLKPMLEDNIYIGKVQNVFNGMQAAFVNIGVSKNVYIHLRDVLPKNNKEVKGDEIITKFIRPGQPILVQIMKDANNKKGARVTSHISFKGRFLVYCFFTKDK